MLCDHVSVAWRWATRKWWMKEEREDEISRAFSVLGMMKVGHSAVGARLDCSGATRVLGTSGNDTTTTRAGYDAGWLAHCCSMISLVIRWEYLCTHGAACSPKLWPGGARHRRYLDGLWHSVRLVADECRLTRGIPSRVGAYKANRFFWQR